VKVDFVEKPFANVNSSESEPDPDTSDSEIDPYDEETMFKIDSDSEFEAVTLHL